MVPESMTVEKLVSDRQRYALDDHHLDLAFEDCAVHVQSDDEEVVRQLEDYYAPFHAAPQAGQPTIVVRVFQGEPPPLPEAWTPYLPEERRGRVKEEYQDLPDGRVVRKVRTGMVLAFGTSLHAVFGPCLANLNQVINFINNRYIQRRLEEGCLLLHAAGVCLGDRGLALAGTSGKGKSTLALRLVERGCRFVSNDRLLLRFSRGAHRVHGVAKYPRVNPGTLLHHPRLAALLTPEQRERFSALPEEQLWLLEHKFDVEIERWFGEGRYCLHALLSAIVVLNWTRDGGSPRLVEAELSERPDLVAAIRKLPGLFFLPSSGDALLDHSAERYIALLRSRPVYELCGGVDFAAAEESCMDLLQGALVADATREGVR